MSDFVIYLRVFRLAVLVTLLPLCLSGTTLDNIGGYINLSQVRTSLDTGPTTTNLRQEYSGRWNESLSEYLKIEGGYRYFRFDQDQSEQISLWQKENTPSARITFSHPLINISSFMQQKETRGLSSINDLTQKNYEIGLRTRALNLPILSAGYYRSHNLGKSGLAGKNILERRLTVSLDHSLDDIDLRYNFSYRIIDNKVTSLETKTTNHQFRSAYSNIGRGNKKFSYAASYQLDHNKQTDRLPNSETLELRIPVLNGLYLEQGDPAIGKLEIIAGLTDGNLVIPTNPTIEIGAGQTGRNLGVDLGTVRSIGALYIYCNQTSDENLQWSIYISDDNFSWQLYDVNPATLFNTLENRYEILFDTIQTQYLKAVNSGFNQVDNVVVTEIEALQQLVIDGEISQSKTSHLTTLSGNLKFSEEINLHTDVTYQREPSVGLSGRRDNIYNTNRLNHKLSENVLSSFLLQQTHQLSEGIVADVSDYSLQYYLKYDPLKTLNFGWSALARISYFDHTQNSEDLNFAWHGSGTPLRGMSVRLSTSYNRNKRIISDQTTGSWNRELSLEGQLTRSINATFSYHHIQTKVNETGLELKRDRYYASLMWRLTSKINLQGTMSWSRGGYYFESKEAFVYWQMSNAINLNGSYLRSNNSDGSITERKSFNTNCKISSRTSVYFSYIDNQFSQLGRDQSSSLQLGLRSSF